MSARERYKSANAFRTALEARLLQASRTKGDAWLARQRKFIVFDRLLARLFIVAPDRWLLKGAVALDFRLYDRARATIDLDLYQAESDETAATDLIAAAELDLGDYFALYVERTDQLDDLDDAMAIRYRVRADLDGRRFEIVTVDVGFGQEIVSEPDLLMGPDLLSFAGIDSIQVPALPLGQHVAEKLHAYTRIYGEGRQSTRVKDLIDLVLIAENAAFDARQLRQAIEGTFVSRQTQTVPNALPQPPDGWMAPYRALASDTGLDPDIAAGYALAARFLNPILSQAIPANAHWDPAQGTWL